MVWFLVWQKVPQTEPNQTSPTLGTEHKEMEKVLLGMVIGILPSRAVTVVRALLDFIYLSQLQMQTSKTLDVLKKCLKTFHENKTIIVELKIREHSTYRKFMQ